MAKVVVGLFVVLYIGFVLLVLNASTTPVGYFTQDGLWVCHKNPNPKVDCHQQAIPKQLPKPVIKQYYIIV